MSFRILIFVLFIFSVCYGQEAAKKRYLDKVDAADKNLENAEKNRDKVVIEATLDYIATLKKAVAFYTKKGNLDKAVAARDEARELEQWINKSVKEPRKKKTNAEPEKKAEIKTQLVEAKPIAVSYASRKGQFYIAMHGRNTPIVDKDRLQFTPSRKRGPTTIGFNFDDDFEIRFKIKNAASVCLTERYDVNLKKGNGIQSRANIVPFKKINIEHTKRYTNFVIKRTGQSITVKKGTKEVEWTDEEKIPDGKMMMVNFIFTEKNKEITVDNIKIKIQAKD
ncbi:MAG: hypothetical protein HRT89_11775 [Lentisphaeria bacterium]|nr:hypothetical protein [Lentisphaeria bacterium]